MDAGWLAHNPSKLFCQQSHKVSPNSRQNLVFMIEGTQSIQVFQLAGFFSYWPQHLHVPVRPPEGTPATRQ